MFNDRMWATIAIMMVLPMVIGFIVPDPYGSVVVIASSLGMLFYLRKFMNKSMGGFFGSTKVRFQCLICQGTKFTKEGTCWRCGGKQRRPV